MKNLVSVIVPIYNCAQYLLDCLNSILKQTHENIEVILIDDGSTDESPKICDEFCKEHKKFFVHHNKNNGVSYSRNFGIEMAHGEYICFVDADDFIEETYIEKMLSKISEADLVFCRFDIMLPNNVFRKYNETNLVKSVENIHEFKLFFINNRYETIDGTIFTDCIFGSCCRSLFKREIINKHNIRFCENVKLGEDKIFLMEYILNCTKCDVIDDYLYHYRNHADSAVKKYATNYVSNFYESRINTLLMEVKFLSKIDNKIYSDSLINFAKMNFNFNFVINEIKLNPNKSYDKLLAINKNDYKKNLDFNIKLVSKFNKISFKRKVLLFLLKHRNYRLIGCILRRSK